MEDKYIKCDTASVRRKWKSFDAGIAHNLIKNERSIKEQTQVVTGEIEFKPIIFCKAGSITRQADSEQHINNEIFAFKHSIFQLTRCIDI